MARRDETYHVDGGALAVSPSEIKELLAGGTSPCVTVLAGLEGHGIAGEPDRRRVAGLVDDAEQALRDEGLRAPEAADIVRPARRWLDERQWPATWNGLALYLSADMSRRFGLRDTLVDRVVVSDRFVVAPLIRHADHDGRFWVLALSRSDPRLLRGDEHGMEPAQVSLPTFDAIVGVDSPESSLQFHRASGGNARQSVAFHGHGGAKDADKDGLRRWLGAVAGLLDEATSSDDRPMLIAGVDEVIAEFRRATNHPHVVSPASLVGNPDRRSTADLHSASWPVVVRELVLGQRADVERFENKSDTDLVVLDLDEVAAAAAEGRVDVLFAVSAPPEEHVEVVDRAVTSAWSTGAKVYVLDGNVPGNVPAAALLRYSTNHEAGSA